MTELKKQTFSSQFLRPNGVFGSLTILKSAYLLIRFDPALGDTSFCFSEAYG